MEGLRKCPKCSSNTSSITCYTCSIPTKLIPSDELRVIGYLNQTHLPTKKLTTIEVTKDYLSRHWYYVAWRFPLNNQYPGDHLFAAWLANYYSNDTWVYKYTHISFV